ncbi:hypothetical protein OG599_35270 (plasmid) [Streptomyces sp. NBC_01335]|uniref:hypothetical protein n=1 Tax=Streptomyces sp. NBC_01335 TaxID=2903828 RepID=UPI002E11637F|nr:hypothetical protein OG599_35270 [Streptomyces sp. NBC_01335]
MSTSHLPLYDPAVDDLGVTLRTADALDLARKALDKHSSANVHDHSAMIGAAVGLEMSLRALVAALDKEAGR